MSETLPIIFQKKLKEYDFGLGHLFQRDRFASFSRTLKKYFGGGDYELIAAEPAEREDLLLIASEKYIDFTEKFFNLESVDKDISQFSKYHLSFLIILHDVFSERPLRPVVCGL